MDEKTKGNAAAASLENRLERERARGEGEIGDSGGIHTNQGVRVLHYAKIPESILARVNPGTRYRRQIEAGRLARNKGKV